MKTKIRISRVISKTIFVAVAIMLARHAPVRAADYLGASAVLRQAAESKAKPADVKKDDPTGKLRAGLSAFRTNAASLAPAEAAKRWLEFVDQAAKIPPNSRRTMNPTSGPIRSDELLGAMPPPPAWGDLAKLVAARPSTNAQGELREIGLRLLSAMLTHDGEARKREVTALRNKAASTGGMSIFFYQNLLSQLDQSTLDLDDPDAVLQSLERRLKSSRGEGDHDVQVPNLVVIAGMDKAEKFLRRALQERNVRLEFTSPNETSRLARKLALEMIDQLKTPQWGLVNSLDSIDLFEALDKKFESEPSKDGAASAAGPPGISELAIGYGDRKGQAEIYYLLGLVSHDRATDAVAVAKKLGRQAPYLPEEGFKAMEQAGYTGALDQFFYELLSQDPSLPFWDQYVEIAAKAGHTERMLALARTSASREDLSKAKRAPIQQILFTALLAADKVDEGVAEMRRLIAEGDTVESTLRTQDAGRLGLALAKIGVLMQNTNWTEEGISATRKWLDASGNQDSFGWGGSVAGELANLLFDLKRGPEAEAILADALVKEAGNAGGASRFSEFGSSMGRPILVQLAALYHKAGRSADVVTLLQESPSWNAADLSELTRETLAEYSLALRAMHTPANKLPLAYVAASALADLGRKEEARKITDALLESSPGLDRGYELLLKLDPDHALARLDELFARDQFEERPLIWKARLLREQGRLDEAEKMARQAIAIDPSDGEEGPGDRMRAYSELADSREARGDKKEADFFRGAVKAIRLSESADQFYMAGLLKRAIRMYEDSLNYFADAYCIQSRLAIQLSTLGMNQEAEAHYRRAYELMPDSFGRVESHCFGCERAFDGQRAQSIAEKVFTKLAVERPDKPQVHYLLGYLREEEERFSEARTNYQTAVRLDPDYLNAWARLQELSQHVLMPAADRDQIVLNVLRLDPFGRHAPVSFEHVTDLAGLWNALAAADKRRPREAASLFPLPASKAAMEKANSAQQETERGYIQAFNERQNGNTPAQAISQNAFARLAGELIANENGVMSEE